MMRPEYASPEEIRAFFTALNDSAVNYVLIKNIDGELPGNLPRSKDIDILVPGGELPRYRGLLMESGFSEIEHPESRRTGWIFAYGASECVKHASPGGLLVDAHCELCLKALEGKIWIPFERRVNRRIWATRTWDAENGWWILEDKIRLAYLIGRCVFDKSSFSPAYIADIRRLDGLLDDLETRDIIQTVFFKFTTTLIAMLREGRYEDIVGAYLSFSGY